LLGRARDPRGEKEEKEGIKSSSSSSSSSSTCSSNGGDDAIAISMISKHNYDTMTF
jgi:hypothetical protein